MMMKFARKTLALVLALSLLLCAAFAETAETASEAQVVQNSNPVLATVNGEPIYKSECDDMISYYAQQQMAVTYAQAVQQLEVNRVLELVMKEEGYLEYTEEELAKMRDEIQAVWDGYVDQYVSLYLSEDTEEARAELRKQAEETLYASGYSVDSLLETQKINTGYDRLVSALVPEEAVTEEMIQNSYNELVAQHQSMVGDSAYMRELASMYYGMDLYYMPAGYRNVTHILIKVDEALLKAYQDANENYNNLLTKFEAQNSAAEAPAEETAPAEEAAAEPAEAEAAPAEEAPAEPVEAEAAPAEEVAAESTEAEAAPTEEAVPEEPVTEEQLEEARLAMEAAKEAVLQSKKAELDDIETRLAAGEAFETLIAQYNEDTGLNPAVGYEVHRESIMWDPVFRDAAFSEEMAQPGDHSKPVVGSYGIHILYYLSDAPEGAVPMTADARSQIVESLRSQLINEALYNIYEEKLPELTITKDDAAIAALDGTNSDVTIDFEAEPAEGQPEASEVPAETEAPAEPVASKAPEAPAETEAPAAETEAEPAEQTEQQ